MSLYKTIEGYGKEFAQQVKGLCAKWYDMINDPMWAYEDLWQEAECLILSLEIEEKKRLDAMTEKERRSYLFTAIKYHFMDAFNRSENRKKAEDKFFG